MNSTGGTNGRADIRVGTVTTPSEQDTYRTPNITDQHSELLDNLTAIQRRGITAMLSTGFYDGWRPTRSELIRYLQDEYGITSLNHRLGIAEQVPEQRR